MIHISSQVHNLSKGSYKKTQKEYTLSNFLLLRAASIKEVF